MLEMKPCWRDVWWEGHASGKAELRFDAENTTGISSNDADAGQTIWGMPKKKEMEFEEKQVWIFLVGQVSYFQELPHKQLEEELLKKQMEQLETQKQIGCNLIS